MLRTLIPARWFVFWLLAVWHPGAHPAQNIEITGVNKAVEENLRLHLSRLETLPLEDKERLQKRLQRPVTQALQALGYYNATVEYQRDEGELTLRITPGEVVTWGDVEIRIVDGGDLTDSEFAEFISRHPFAPGTPINHGVYENFKREFLSLAQRNGYIDATLIQHRLRIDLSRLRADVSLLLSSGERYRIAAIDYTGSDLSPQLLQKMVKLSPGDNYTVDKIGQAYNLLLNSGYFSSVDIDTQPQPPNQVKLDIALKDAPSYRYSTGAGFGTDTGPRLSFSWQRPRVNRRGDSVEVNLEASGISKELSLQYRIPWHNPLERYLSWQSGYQQKKHEDTKTDILTTGLAYHNLESEKWQYSYHLNLEQEKFRQGLEPEQTVTYLVPSSNWTRTQANGEASEPHYWGYKLWFGVQASSTAIGSDTDFVRFSGGLRYLNQWSEKNQFIARMEGGAIFSGDFLQVPSSRRFFTGGDQTVRGFDFETLSPQDSAGELIGGQYLNVASLEYRRLWLPSWQWALFTDSGRAYSHGDEPFHSSVGIGLRWLSPIGVVALDIAQPLARDRGDSPRLHIYMGLPL